ncbi:GNAT family N-acetyltransferase [Heyndrickxia sp. NPDC080065]|uniref:GNAT family N-acetyltransferase n=1 Tax=Heyndrickxia sp. NPDC080065 TaxID=3390568 RepID=UPI003D03A0A0
MYSYFFKGVKFVSNVEIRRPRVEDIEELHQFFDIVIKDTFANERLSELADDIENEIESKKKYLKYDFESYGKERYFLIAFDKMGNKIIGTIEYGPASELIDKLTEGAMKDLHEIGTVFVHPDYQGRGIGRLLLNVMFLTLLNREIKEFCLDSGYSNAQKIWKKKFGEPDYFLQNYWSEGSHHMIWRRSINDMSIVFSR